MLQAKFQPTLMISSLRLTQDGTIAHRDLNHHRSIVRVLQCLIITRSKLSFFVNKVCQFIHVSQEHHYKAVKWILCYVADTLHHGLILKPSPSLSIIGFSNSDWVLDLDDERSTGGYCVYLGKNFISWVSRKQKVV